MGNQEIKSQMGAIVRPDFNGQEVADNYTSFAFKGATTEQIKQFISAIEASTLSPSAQHYLSEQMRKCFPQNSCIDFNSSVSHESRWDWLAENLWQTGYTSWQHNLTKVNSSDYKNVVMAQNRSMAEFEFSFYSRCMILCSNFMMRHQCGSEIKDIFTYFQEHFDNSEKSYPFKVTAQTAFLHLLNGFASDMQNPEKLLSVLDALYMSTSSVESGSLFQLTQEGMALDLVLKRISEVIQTTLAGNPSPEMVATCVKVIMRFGLLSANPVYLIMAAQYQLKFKIDISNSLQFFFGESEIFVQPKSATEDTGKLFTLGDKNRIQNKCDYETENRQHPHDKMACDGAFYYTYSETRGLAKAKRKADCKNEWEIAKINSDSNVKGFIGATLMVHQGNLYIRHSKVEKGFLRIDTSDMKIHTSEVVEFADEESQRFCMTTSENVIEHTERGKRWMRTAPMCSDGVNIYTIVEYRKDGIKSDRVSSYVEIYEFADNKLKFVKDIKLMDQEEKNWIGGASKSIDTEKGGYFDFGHMACNGNFLVWHSPRNVHIFDLKSQKRVMKENRHSGKHIMCFESISSLWYSCDADCYSWLDEWSIKGFKTIVRSGDDDKEDFKLPEVPVVLDEPKAKIKGSIIKTSPPSYKLNLFSQLIGGELETTTQAETQAAYQESNENVNKQIQEALQASDREDLTENNYIYDYSRAIILSHVSKTAQFKNFYARANGSKQLDGEKMLQYFKSKWGIYVSESIFKQLRLAITEVLDEYHLDTAHITERFTLKSLLHIYLAHIGCLRPLKVPIRQFLSVEEMKLQKALIEQFDSKITLFPGQKKNATDEDNISEQECFQLHIYHLSKQVYDELSDLLSTQTVEQKLVELNEGLVAFEGQQESVNLLRMLKRYQTAELAEVFSQDVNALKKSSENFVLANKLIQQRIVARIEGMINDPSTIDDNFNGFGSEESAQLVEFSFNYVQELLANYGNHIKAILDNEPKEVKEGEEVDKEEKEKMAKAYKFAETRKEALNDFVYETMIQTCKDLKSFLKIISVSILKNAAQIKKLSEEELTAFSSKFENLMIGKYSLVRSVQMFVMSTQLWTVGGNDLDECSLALRAAVEGLTVFGANMNTLLNRYGSLRTFTNKTVEDLQKANRFVNIGLAKVSARLVFNDEKNSDIDNLKTFKVFQHGVAQNYIPLLSDECKAAIEGSFKLVKDEKLRVLCETPADQVEHLDFQKTIRAIANQGDETIDNMMNLLRIEVGGPEYEDYVVDSMVRHAFAALCLFGNRIDQEVQTVIEALQSDNSQLPADSIEKEELVRIYKKANELYQLKATRTREIKDQLKKKLTLEYRKEYKEENPSAKDLPRQLSEEHLSKINQRVEDQTGEKVHAAMRDTLEKCKLLLLFDTHGSKNTINVEGIVEKNLQSYWKDWDMKVANNNIHKAKSDEDQKQIEAEEAESQVMNVIRGNIKSENMSKFVESGQIKGMRRLAGITMFNESLDRQNGELFYDTLHHWQASLRGNKAQLCDYLAGVEGCGGITSGKIRQAFFQSISLIVDKIKQETNEQCLVQLLNALLWDYSDFDLEVLAKQDIFLVLAGDSTLYINEWNKMYTSWGKHFNTYNIKNNDDSVDSIKETSYSLSARLNQVFNFLANKLFSVIFNKNGSFNNSQNLKKVGYFLLQQLFSVCEKKLTQHFDMVGVEPLQAAALRDNEIRVDNTSGEEKDDKEIKLWDEYDVQPDMASKAKERRHAQRIVDHYIYLLESGEETIQGINSQITKQFENLTEDDAIVDAVIARNWRVYDYLCTNSRLFAYTTEDLDKFEGPGDEEADAEKEEAFDSVSTLKEINDKANQQDTDQKKVGELLSQLTQASANERKIEKVRFFSQQVISTFVNYFYLLSSLAQSSRNSAETLKKVLDDSNLSILMRLSVNASAPIQAIVQRTLQNLLTLGIPLKNLDEAVQTAAQRDETKLVNKIKDYEAVKLNLDSVFWQFMYNQVYIASEAQESSAFQVNVGKPVVIEEVLRTFYTVLTNSDLQHSQEMQNKIVKAIVDIDRRSAVEIASLMKLVPQAHQPIIAAGTICHDTKSNDFVIVVGFAKMTDTSHNYKSKLSMSPVEKTNVVGLTLSKSEIQLQALKAYDLRNLIPTQFGQTFTNVNDAENQEQVKKFKKMVEETSVFMNPEVLTKLITRMIKKDQFIRSTNLAIQQYSLQDQVQRGIFQMLKLFGKQYLVELKSYNQLENLINFLTKEAANQTIKPNEALVSSEMLNLLVGQVKTASSYTNRNIGQFGKLQMYIDEKEKKSAFLQRVPDEDNSAEFLIFDIMYTVNDFAKEDKRLVTCSNGHSHAMLSAHFNKVELDAEKESSTCQKCQKNMMLIDNISQCKSGLSRCLDCNLESVICNQCAPKPQWNEELALQVSMYKINAFRPSRSEVVFMSSAELTSMNNAVLQTIMQTNVVVTDSGYSLLQFTQNLAIKVIEDSRYKPCANVRFVVVSPETFKKALSFLNQEPLVRTSETRGSLLTKIYSKIDIAQRMINNPQTAQKFVTEFLVDYNQEDLKEYISQTVPQILKKYIGEEYSAEEAKEREKEEKKMMEQLQHLDRPVVNDKIDSASRSSSRIVGSSNERTPDFMSKFTENSFRLIKENGSTFFESQSSGEDKDEFAREFETFVFESTTDANSINELQRTQLRSSLLKSNQIAARSIWFEIMSNLGNKLDDDTQSSITASVMHIKICDFIHESIMAANYQRQNYGSDQTLEIVHEQTTNLLKYYDSLSSGQKFRSFFIKDFLKRADQTIEQIRKDDYQELGNYRTKDLRKVAKIQNVLDPDTLIFLSRLIFKMKNYLVPSQRAEMAKVIFDLHLGFALVFGMEQDQKVCYALLKGCAYTLDLIIADIDSLLSNPQSITSLLSGEMITGLFAKMDQSQSDVADIPKQQLLTELIFRLNKIYNLARRNSPDNAPTQPPFKDTEKTQNLLVAYNNLSSGQKFTSLMSRIKLLALLNDSEHHGLVSQYGETYFTDNQMYKTYFEKTYKATKSVLISVDQTTSSSAFVIKKVSDKSQIVVDKDAILSGKATSMRLAEGEEALIEFPVQINAVKMSGKLNNRHGDGLSHDDWEDIAVSASQVHARHNHAMFITDDEQVWGIGYRAQGSEAVDGKLRKIITPEECKNFKKCSTGKFFRLILTEDRRLFFSGQNKKYMLGKDLEKDHWKNSFTEVVNFYPYENTNEKIIDMAGGQHFLVVITDANKIYGSGYSLYRACGDVRSNANDNEDEPFKIASPEGYTPMNVWACDRYVNIWITCVKNDDPTVFKTFSIGADYDMVACGDSSSRSNWADPQIPEGIYFKNVVSQGMSAYGVDNEGLIWEWGDHRMTNKDGSPPFYDKHGSGSGRSTPYRFIWFKDNDKTLLQVESGAQWAMMQTKDNKTGQIELYGYSDSCTDGRFGKGLTEVYQSTFQRLGNQFTHADVTDFSLMKNGSFVCVQKKVEKLSSVVKDDPDYRGLVHFYKQNGEWNYVKESEFASKNFSMPPIVFATRHPIKNFEAIKDDKNFLPNIDDLTARCDMAKKSKAHDMKSTLSGETIMRDRLYYAIYNINGVEVKMILTYDEVTKGGQFFDFQPMLFYSLVGPVHDLNQLPKLSADKLFHRCEEPEMVNFSITQAEIDPEDIMSIPNPTQEFDRSIQDIVNFDKQQDLELIRAVDALRAKNFKDMNLAQLKPKQFDTRQFNLPANSQLNGIDEQLKQNRTKLLVEFSIAAATLLPSTFHEETPNKGQLSSLMKENQDIILPSIKKNLFMKKCEKFWDQRDTSISSPFDYNKSMADEFRKKGLKNDPKWITDSTFGQLFTQMKLRDSDFSMMQNSGNSFETNFLNGDSDKEDNQAAYCFRHMELDLMSDQLPLFIRVPNGRNRAGQKRDCFMPNPRADKQDWLKCFQFIGALIGRVIFKDHLFFGVPMAPTFWMLVKGSQPDLQAFAHEDARLAKRLARFEGDEFYPGDTWYWINSADQPMPIDPEDPEKPVTEENLAEFKEKLLEKLTNESALQIQWIYKGIKHSLGYATHYIDYCNWHDLMEMTENNEKLKPYDNISLIKEGTEYKDVEEDNEQITRFWTVYGKLNREDKKLFFNFVGGRSHLTDKAHRFEKKLIIRVDTTIPNNGRPQSFPNQNELVLPESYDSEEIFTEKLLESLAEGIGLEPCPL